jgi:RND family efflux transporter MFP subunit
MLRSALDWLCGNKVARALVIVAVTATTTAPELLAQSGDGSKGETKFLQLPSADVLGHFIKAQLKAGAATETAEARPVLVHDDYIGRFSADRSVSVRPRIGGVLVRVNVNRNQEVKQGDLLFEIDPRVQEIELRKAMAELLRCEALMKLSMLEFDRVKRLSESNVISQTDVTKAETGRDVAQAQIESAKASVELARLALDSTRVVAPIDGRFYGERLDAGEVVTDKTVLGKLVSTDPIAVRFEMPEDAVLRIVRGGKTDPGAERSSGLVGLPVEIGLVDETTFERKGEITEVDAQFSDVGSTLGCRALLPNPDGQLLPGMMARIRRPRMENLPLVPIKAILEGKDRWKLLVGQGDEWEVRDVILGEGQPEGFITVTSGLKAGEKYLVPSQAKPEKSAPPDDDR